MHFPWCRRRCGYCDFAIAVAPDGEIPGRAYTDAVLRELERRSGEVEGGRLSTLYFGGGTPALWEPELLGEVVRAVAAVLPGESMETTLECNPADVTDAHLQAWRAVGIGRVSIGVQTQSAEDLVTLGRPASMGHDLDAVARAMAAGFEVSADVIVGIPGSSEPLATARALADLGVPHISAYELTVEERTPLAAAVARGEVAMPAEDALAEQYAALHELLEGGGYEHYEVSSYARPGHRAVHNQGYWVGRECVGLGNSAASLLHCGEGALRTVDGADEGLFAGMTEVVDGLLRDGLVERVGSCIVPTLKGFLCGDEVARRVFGP